MSRRPDFARDIAGVKLDVSEGVASILSAVRQRPPARDATTPAPSPNVSESPPKQPETPTVRAPARRPRATPQPTSAGASMTLRNVTTKLPLQTKELLREAALRQRLKRATPDTEQGIIDDALQAWFKRHGYGRRLTGVDDSPSEPAEIAEDSFSSE